MLDLDWISKSDFDTSVNDVPKLVKREANKSSIFLKDSPHFVSIFFSTGFCLTMVQKWYTAAD